MLSPGSAAKAQIADLYSQNQSMLKGWLQKKLGCSHIASDLLHDTFLRLLKKGVPIEASDSAAYVMIITKRVLIDYWRRLQIEKAYLEVLAAIPEEIALDIVEQHILLETLLEIDRLLNGLPEVVKQTFLYSQLDGLKQQQIATKLNISLSSVKRYLVQAGTQCLLAMEDI